MTPVTISGATHVLQPPEGWEDTPERTCELLAVRVDGDVFQSAWRPSEEDFVVLCAGGSIVPLVVGRQPPVALHVEAPTASMADEIAAQHLDRILAVADEAMRNPGSATDITGLIREKRLTRLRSAPVKDKGTIP
ncbi:MAG TPA: hypothetical protein VNR89_11875 [Roseomonas sp.]|nr:hypothetical protein [Roseomonas sp.]